jgi:cysteine-rich repeat protein
MKHLHLAPLPLAIALACGGSDDPMSADTGSESSSDTDAMTTAPSTSAPSTSDPSTSATTASTTADPDTGETDDPSDSDTDESTDTGTPASCGDAIIDDGEQCDDGNDVDGDGCNTDCVASGAVIWEVHHDVVGFGDCAYDVDVNAAGTIAISGEAQSEDGDTYDVLTAQIGADGTIAWAAVHDSENPDESAGGSTDRAYGVGIEDDGEIVVAGHELLENERVWVRKYDAAGEALWTRTGPDTADGRGYGVALGTDGEVFVVGTHGLFAFASKYNTNGIEFWTEERKGSDGCNGCDRLWRAVALDDGGVIVTGALDNETSDFYIARMDADGNDVWSDTVDSGNMYGDYPLGFTALGDSTLVIIQWGDEAAREMRRYDADGNVEWMLDSPGMGLGEVIDVAAMGDGGFVTVSDGWGGDDVGTVATVERFDADGGPMWSTEIVTTLDEGAHEIRGIATGGGRVVVAGCEYLAAQGSNDAWVVSLAE